MAGADTARRNSPAVIASPSGVKRFAASVAEDEDDDEAEAGSALFGRVGAAAERVLWSNEGGVR